MARLTDEARKQASKLKPEYEEMYKQMDNETENIQQISSEEIEGRERPITLAVKINEEELGWLEKIKTWYRSPTNAHAVRLMIEDVAKGIESRELLSRFK